MDALSVHNGRAMEGYRTTMDLRTDSASTEQLREAMIHYRALFEDLLNLGVNAKQAIPHEVRHEA